jgi:hypothetical protein
MRAHLGAPVEGRFHHAWTHPDPRMDALQARVEALVAEAADRRVDAAATFARVRALADEAAGRPARPSPAAPDPLRARPPRITEPWFC